MTPAEYERELARRMSAKDVDGTLELIAEDAVYFWSNGSAMFGKEAIAEGLRQNFASIQNDTYEKLDITWLAQSDGVAACVFRFEWTGEIDGELVSGRGRGASVLRRIDGVANGARESEPRSVEARSSRRLTAACAAGYRSGPGSSCYVRGSDVKSGVRFSRKAATASRLAGAPLRRSNALLSLVRAPRTSSW